MKFRKFALAGVTALAMTGSAFAFTHHPATPAENAATDQLNAQALANAQAGTSNAGTTTTTNVNSGPINGGMMTGTQMNSSGVDENGNANVAPPKDNAKAAPPAQPKPNNNGQ